MKKVEIKQKEGKWNKIKPNTIKKIAKSSFLEKTNIIHKHITSLINNKKEKT